MDRTGHLIGHRTGHRALVDRHHVHRRQQQGHGTQGSDPAVLAERAGQHHELRDEARQARQGQRGQARDQQEAGHHRGDLLHPAERGDVGRPAALHHEPDDQE
ncbi:hypothetical protein SDC9_96331 [bioreactor metagenome]|uniref:Uncharacterized protein n=1 Tax=bioreactor metagenome TaxID=1076179 RepID=A0A645ABD5_9ZZZZ